LRISNGAEIGWLCGLNNAKLVPRKTAGSPIQTSLKRGDWLVGAFASFQRDFAGTAVGSNNDDFKWQG